MSGAGTFRSLRNHNYRLWAGGALVSNVGTWLQRTAQDWLVLVQLTHHNATAVGIVTALQFGPQVVLLPLTGLAADTFDRRRLLGVTQGAMGLLALGLGVLTLTNWVHLWHVYCFALALGCVTAFDTPARQTFVAELVGEGDLSNAVALNSTSFNLARMLGPAAAGILIGAVGEGWAFVLNAASFGAVLASLGLLRTHELHVSTRAKKGQAGLMDGFRYVWGRPDLRAILLMFFLIGTFTLNFPIYISTMSVAVFHGNAQQYGLLTSTMAVGSVTGALLSARRAEPRITLLLGGSLVLAIGVTLAALMPSYWLFGAALLLVGVSAQTFTTTANGLVQLSTEAAMRGRVMAILMAIALGGAPLGSPLVGRVADVLGPRYAMGVGATAAFIAAGVALGFLARAGHLRRSTPIPNAAATSPPTEGPSDAPA